MKPDVPHAIKAEHEELHSELLEATRAGGRTGAAARTVADLLHLHFLKEEEYALPPLGLLSVLAGEEEVLNTTDVLSMTEKLKKDLSHMLEEHRQIGEALRILREAAKSEQQEKHARFADKLALHAEAEEEVFYPAAILVGEYLKLKLSVREKPSPAGERAA